MEGRRNPREKWENRIKIQERDGKETSTVYRDRAALAACIHSGSWSFHLVSNCLGKDKKIKRRRNSTHETKRRKGGGGKSSYSAISAVLVIEFIRLNSSRPFCLPLALLLTYTITRGREIIQVFQAYKNKKAKKK